MSFLVGFVLSETKPSQVYLNSEERSLVYTSVNTKVKESLTLV